MKWAQLFKRCIFADHTPCCHSHPLNKQNTLLAKVSTKVPTFSMLKESFLL